MRNTASSAPGLPLLALAQLADKLAFAHADVMELGGDGVRERGCGGVSLRTHLNNERVRLEPRRRRPRRAAAAAGSTPSSSAASSSRASAARDSSSSYVAARNRRFASAIRSRPASSSSSRPGSASSERGTNQTRRGLAQTQLDVAQLVAGTLELGREALQRGDRTLRDRDEARRAVALVRRERRGGGCSRLRELGHMAEAFAVCAQLVLTAVLHPLGVLGKRAQLRDARLGEGGVRGELVVPLARRLQLPPRTPHRLCGR